MTRKLAALCAMLALAPSAVTHAAQLVARAPRGVTPDAEKLLAASAEPWRINLRDEETLLDAARQFCGRLTPTYVDLLSEANKDRAPNSQAIVPACFVARNDVEVALTPTDTLASVAYRSVGAVGPKTLGSIISANSELSSYAAWSTMPVVAYSPGLEALVIPTATEPVAYQLKQGLDVSNVSNDLSKALNLSPGLATGPSPLKQLTLEADVVPGSGRAVPCSSALASKYAQWPFAVSDVTSALARIDAVRLSKGLGPMPTAVVGVVDNGMDRIFTTEFPRDDFVLNTAEVLGATPDPDGNGYAGDIVGTNIYDGGQPVAYPLADKPGHGTIMASLALGGAAYRGWQKTNYPARRVKITVVSLLRVFTQATTSGSETTYTMPPEGLEAALLYALARGAKTINLSISADSRLQSVENAIFNHDDLLLVVAAGNSAYDLNVVSRYPASESAVEREHGGRIVTVAAHGQNGCLGKFSGRGTDAVDLGAPGLAIQGIGLGGTPVTAEGTSQATALTSFVSSLIRAASDLPPAGVKDRLHASVDLNPDLAPYVRSGGALNVRKALSLFDDVVELQGIAGPIFGRLEGERSAESFCPSLDDDERQVLKVSKRVDGGDTTRVRILLRNAAKKGELQVVHCAPTQSEFVFKALDGSQTRFGLHELVDFVPAL